MSEYNRLNVKDLVILLTDRTCLNRYHSLIPRVPYIIDKLGEYGIYDQFDFFREYLNSDSEFSRFARNESDLWALLNTYFEKRKVAERKLREFTSVDECFLARLAANGIKTCGDFMRLCENSSARDLCAKYCVSETQARELLSMCDITRIAGIKHIRSRLYIDSGYRNTVDIACDDNENMLKKVTKHISDNSLSLAPPLSKEVETTIATAKTLSIVSFKDEKNDCSLMLPDERFLHEITEYRSETLAVDGYINGGGGLSSYTDAFEWVRHSRDMMKAENVSEPYVESTQFIYVRECDRKIIGTLQVRRRLNETLLISGGHIGYSIRPSERRKGYGKRMLASALNYCRWLALDRVLITCAETNEASRRTILVNGGVYENTLFSTEHNQNTQRYWVTI